MVSAVVIMEKIDSKIQKNLKYYEKSDLRILNPSGEYLINLTVRNILNTNVDECIVVLYDNSDEISESLKLDIEYVKKDKRLKIITFQERLKLTEVLLKGINEVKSDYCICISAYQPLIYSETLKKLIDKVGNNDNKNIFSILERKKFKIFNNGPEMPFVCKTEILKKSLSSENINLKKVLKKITKESLIFRVHPINKYELIIVDNCKNFKRFFKFHQGNEYKSSKLNLILNFFSLKNLSKNFKVFFTVYSIFIAIILTFMFIFPSNFFFTSTNNIQSLIETIVQSQSAIIAIVITLSLVAVQLTASSYSPRVISIFKNSLSLWILIFSYLLTMTYGLIFLKFFEVTSNNEIQLWVALFLSIFSFFALIPFLLDMLDLMKPSKIIDQLGNEINDYHVLYSIEKFDEDEIQPIVDIIHTALMKYDYGTLKSGLKAIVKYNERIFTNTTTFDFEKRKLSECILEHLSRVGKLAVNLNDDDAASLILNTISYNIIQVQARKYDNELLEAIWAVRDIAILSVNKNLDFSVFTSLTMLQQIWTSNVSKFIIDEIFRIYDQIEKYTTNEKTINQISGYRAMRNKLSKD